MNAENKENTSDDPDINAFDNADLTNDEIMRIIQNIEKSTANLVPLNAEEVDKNLQDPTPSTEKKSDETVDKPTESNNPSGPGGDNQCKSITVSNVSNVANVTRNPMMPHMFFSNSNVTVNYNFIQK